MIQELSVQDWGAIVSVISVIGGSILGLCKWLKRKLRVKEAKIRINLIKLGNSWRFRVYNASDEDIEALNIRVLFPNEDGYDVQWDSEKDSFPSLKRHGNFDIFAVLYTSSTYHTTIQLKWNQVGSKKQFTTTETVSLE